MAKKSVLIKPVAAAVGVAFVSSLVVSTTAVASENPFDAAELDTGYMLAGGHEKDEGEGKCGEGKCGEETDEEGDGGEEGDEEDEGGDA